MQSLINKPIESSKFKLRSSFELAKIWKVGFNSEITPVVRILSFENNHLMLLLFYAYMSKSSKIIKVHAQIVED